jgi:hypothetical protein
MDESSIDVRCGLRVIDNECIETQLINDGNVVNPLQRSIYIIIIKRKHS